MIMTSLYLNIRTKYWYNLYTARYVICIKLKLRKVTLQIILIAGGLDSIVDNMIVTFAIGVQIRVKACGGPVSSTKLTI